eukprot:gene8200-11092_t
MFIAEKLHNNAHLLFIWDVNDACPGHFLEVYEPLSTVTFIANYSESNFPLSIFSQHALKVYPMSRNGFDQTMLEYDVNLVVKRRFWWNAQVSLYKKFILVKDVQRIVSVYVEENNICNSSSMHIRQTDMDVELKAKQRANINKCRYFVETRPLNESVYLMTDNPKTQSEFLSSYGSTKIKVYMNITPEENQVPIQLSKEGTNKNNKNGNNTIPKLALDHRFTTLQHAVIDIHIAAHAKEFRASAFSSVSDLVKMIRGIHRWDGCDCDTRYCY